MRNFAKILLTIAMSTMTVAAQAQSDLATLFKNEGGYPSWTHKSKKFRLITNLGGHVLYMSEHAEHKCIIPNKPENNALIATIQTAMSMGKGIVVFSGAWNVAVKVPYLPTNHNGDIHCLGVVMDW